MKRAFAMILPGLIAISLAAVACRPAPRIKGAGFTELQRADVVGEIDLEIVMGLIERPGESASGKHHHPGGEFGFVLEGEVTVATEGDAGARLEAGSSFYQPPGEWHIVSTTGVGTRTVVFRVVRKGEPMVVTVD